MRRNDTYWTSLQACDQVFKETGAIPTIVVIRDRIGINSPNIISQAIKDFKGSLADQVVKARKDLTGMPAPVVNLAMDLWEAAKAEALASAQQRQDEWAGREQALVAEIAQLSLELEQHQQLSRQLADELDQTQASLQQAHERHKQSETNRQTERHLQQDRYNQLEARFLETAEELTQEKQRRISAEVAYEKQNEWALKRIDEEKDSLKKHYNKELSQLKSSTQKLKADNQLLQAKLEKSLKTTPPMGGSG